MLANKDTPEHAFKNNERKDRDPCHTDRGQENRNKIRNKFCVKKNEILLWKLSGNAYDSI